MSRVGEADFFQDLIFVDSNSTARQSSFKLATVSVNCDVEEGAIFLNDLEAKSFKDAWRHLKLFIGHDNNNTQDREHCDCCDRDAWRHLKLFIGHDNNNTQDREHCDCCDRYAWRHLKLFIGHDNNNTQDREHCDCCDRDAWRHLKLFIGHDNNNTQDREHCDCCDRDAWRHLKLFIGHDNNNTQDREHCDCCDRYAWRHLKLFIGHDNNNTQDREHCDCCDRDAWRHLKLFIGHDNNNTQDREHCDCCDRDAWRHLKLFIGHDNNNTQDREHCDCCDRDAWRHLKLFIGHNNNTQDREHCDCCDRDAWRHLKLFIGHDNNNTQDREHCDCCDIDAWRHLKLFIGHDNNNTQDREHWVGCGLQMKYLVQSQGPQQARLGLLSEMGELVTPCYLGYTRAGSVPHLTPDILHKVLPPQHPLLFTLPSVGDMQASLADFNKGLSHYVGLPTHPGWVTMQDPGESIRTGYNTKLGISIWANSGRVLVTPDIFMNLMESIQPCAIQVLTNSDANKDSTSKKLTLAVKHSIEFLDKCLSRIKESQVLKNSMIFGTIQGGCDRKLKIYSAMQTAKREVDGFVIDGLNTYGPQEPQLEMEAFTDLLLSVVELLPKDKPRMLNGPLNPIQIIKAVSCGIDIFDSSYPYIITEQHKALVFDPEKPETMTISLKDQIHKEEFTPLLKNYLSTGRYLQLLDVHVRQVILRASTQIRYNLDCRIPQVLKQYFLSDDGNNTDKHEVLTVWLQMKYLVQSQGPQQARLGLLSEAGELVTPCYLGYTRAGSVPHLTPDILHKVLPPQHPLLFTLPSVGDMQASLADFNKGLSHYVGLPTHPGWVTMQDPGESIRPGYNTKLGISIWANSGRVLITPDIFMNLMESIQPCAIQVLTNSDANIDSTSKKLTLAVKHSIEFLDKCLSRIKESQVLKNSMIFGTIQGGCDRKLKIYSAMQTAKREVDGFVIDGLNTYGPQEPQLEMEVFTDLLLAVVELLPKDKPRMLNGPLNPIQIIKAVSCGIDIFDSSYPYVITEQHKALVFDPEKPETMTISLKDQIHKEEFTPLLKNCECYACANFTRAYIHHLYCSNELLGFVLLMVHNLHHFNLFFHTIQTYLQAGTFNSLMSMYDKSS
ncbi:QTRTD1 [Cordylochernes scorpioides]|uniref:Queuine tRNA-ribosyltransferase accessory subunit 2 n=1 Tax=Cordylochernes scorpioides TaxID=51811 RepID=A0ABY6LBN9_9ARAC|nr:QTRTD1 [Cordylochernes scorpioides]